MSSQLLHLDRSVALSRLGGDEELLQEIARLFLDDYPAVLREIRAAVETGDARKLESGAHTLKGSVANFGAREVVAAAYSLETIGRSGGMHGAVEALRELEMRLAELEPDLTRICGVV